MQAFADSGYNKKDLRLLNLCRLWAKAITLADITTGTGTHLIPESLKHNFVPPQYVNRGWPTAGKPNRHCWKLWTQALATCFLQHLEPQHKLKDEHSAPGSSGERLRNGIIPHPKTAFSKKTYKHRGYSTPGNLIAKRRDTNASDEQLMTA
jgi:hypothetical protein